MDLKLRITGLCALITDSTLVSTKEFTATTSTALALMVGPRGHAGHGPHAAAAHSPVLLVEYPNLQRATTAEPDRMVDDPVGRHWACYDLRESTLKLRHPPEGPVELMVGHRQDEDVCTQSELAWRDISSVGELRRAYPDAVLKDDCLLDAPPSMLPIIARVVFAGGRLESITPSSWALDHHWRFANGFRRALTEGLEYTATLPGAQATLRIEPYDSTKETKTITLEGGSVGVALSNLSTQLVPSPAMLNHIALYHELFTTSATVRVPEAGNCPDDDHDTTFPDVCPMMWLRRPEST